MTIVDVAKELEDAGLSNAEQVTDLLSKGYTLVEVRKAGFAEAAFTESGVSSTEYAAAEASIAAETAAAAAAANSSTTLIIVVSVAFVIVVIVVGAAVYIKKTQAGAGGESAGTAHASFENPLYDAQPAYTGGGGGSSGYMDVGGVGNGSLMTAGYMDVNAASSSAPGGDGVQGGGAALVGISDGSVDAAPGGGGSSGYMDVAGGSAVGAADQTFGGFDDDSDDEEV